VLVFFLGGHWRKPIDFSVETMAQAAAQAEGFRNVFRGPSETGGDWEAFAAALEDDFNTPEALALMHEWRDHDLLRRALAVFAESLADRRAPPPCRTGRAGRRTRLSTSTRGRVRAEIEADGGEMRDEPGGTAPRQKRWPRPRLRTSRRAEALRRREVLELWRPIAVASGSGSSRRCRSQRAERDSPSSPGPATIRAWSRG
jgi:hypothetical protein